MRFYYLSSHLQIITLGTYFLCRSGMWRINGMTTWKEASPFQEGLPSAVQSLEAELSAALPGPAQEFTPRQPHGA